MSDGIATAEPHEWHVASISAGARVNPGQHPDAPGSWAWGARHRPAHRAMGETPVRASTEPPQPPHGGVAAVQPAGGWLARAGAHLARSAHCQATRQAQRAPAHGPRRHRMLPHVCPPGAQPVRCREDQHIVLCASRFGSMSKTFGRAPDSWSAYEVLGLPHDVSASEVQRPT